MSNQNNQNQNNESPNLGLDLRRMLLFSAAALAVMYLLSAWAWVQIPAGTQVPIHWNVQGEVDGYGSKFWGLLLLPLVNTAVVILFAALPRIEPRRENFIRSHKAYFSFWAVFLVFMLVLHIALIAATLGYAVPIDMVVPIMTGLIFVVLGNFMGKVRSNYMMGIRTPWTLTSDESWNKTHRLGGKLFMLVGGLTILAALFWTPEATFAIMIGGVFIMLAVLFAYSYYVWKNDPNAKRA